MPQKRQLREEQIIQASISLFAEKGFLGVRMSDIAKNCEISMGTIYSHFAAKEDLLMACATTIVARKMTLFRSIIESGIPVMQRIVTSLISSWLISQHHQDLIEMVHLSLMPSIWKRAKQEHVSKQIMLHESFFELAQPLILEMLSNEFNNYTHLDRTERESLALQFNHGVWGLCVGLNSTAQSGMAAAYSREPEACSYHLFSTNVIHFLQGYGWKEKDPQAFFDRCREKATVILAQDPWFACPETSEQGTVA